MAQENLFPIKTKENLNQNPDILLLLQKDSTDWIPQQAEIFDTKKVIHLVKVFGIQSDEIHQDNSTTKTADK